MQSEKISVKDALKVLVLDPLKASLVSLLFCFLKLLDLLRFSPMFLLLFFYTAGFYEMWQYNKILEIEIFAFDLVLSFAGS